MRMIKNSRVSKILFLAAVLILMLGLCGCRTRITNNDEVSNVMYDEEGLMNKFAKAYGYKKPAEGDADEASQD